MKTAKKKPDYQKTGSREMRLYLKEISKIPLLTVAEEREVAHRSQNGDREALQKLVESNLRFVISVARKYNGLGLSMMDLINEGNLGLLEAARRFDPTRNVKFTSYAVWWIRQSMLLALSKFAHPLRLPPKIANLAYKIGKSVTRNTSELHGKPRLEDIAIEFGLTQPELGSIMGVSRESASLSQPVDKNGELLLGDLLEQHTHPPVDSSTESRMLEEGLDRVLGSLHPNEQKVLRLRFGLGDDTPRTLSEIGAMMGLSRERIRQIEAGALRKIRACPQSDSLASYLN